MQRMKKTLTNKKKLQKLTENIRNREIVEDKQSMQKIVKMSNNLGNANVEYEIFIEFKKPIKWIFKYLSLQK